MGVMSPVCANENATVCSTDYRKELEVVSQTGSRIVYLSFAVRNHVCGASCQDARIDSGEICGVEVLQGFTRDCV